MNLLQLIEIMQVVLYMSVVAALFFVVASLMYDSLNLFKRTNKHRTDDTSTHTVLVYACNNVDTIQGCLESLNIFNEKGVDIAVVDNGSSDGTATILRRYRRSHPNHVVYLKKKPIPYEDALLQIYRKSQKGELVWLCRANAQIDSRWNVSTVASRFKSMPIHALLLNTSFKHWQSIDGMFSLFMRLSQTVVYKAGDFLGLLYLRSQIEGVVYRREIFLAARNSKRLKFGFESRVFYLQKPSPITVPFVRHIGVKKAARQKVSLIAVLACVIMVLMISFSFILASFFIDRQFLFVGWLLVSLWALIAVFTNHALTLGTKVTYLFCIPLLYFLLYVYGLGFIIGMDRSPKYINE
ncbi:MAG: hypothetical protein JWN33_53 [Candidatus Saccharibacteria bacterium]|nr:hypothetical protein [Candidatus Saccharibacteria bacterium]